MELKTLGPYRLGEPLGKGGMGEVFVGTHGETGDRVAIKVLNPVMANASGFRERFEAEIDSLRKLHHPNIVQMYGFGEQEGVLFYTMELVDGRSLEDELCAGRRFDWREVVQIGIQLCKALKHAHDHGVIHRDLKPANVLLTEQDEVKLLDFGIARLFGGTQMTSAGGVLGTADYMAPEQADGRPVTEQCDQYSLGGVLYALAAGRPPFRAATLPELLQMQRFAEPEPLRKLAPHMPAELERCVMQLLAKQPEDRFPNAGVLARHMAAMEKALSRPVEPESADDILVSDEEPVELPPAALGETRTASTRGDDSPPAEEEEALHVQLPAPLDTAAPPSASSVVPPSPRSAEQAGDTPAAPARSLADASPETAPSPSEPRYTTLEEARRRDEAQQRESRLLRAVQLGGLVAALAATVAGLWFFTRPPTADALYEEIVVASDAEENRPQAMLAAADAIEQFGARFADDPRAGEVAAYLEELELLRAERRLRARARLRGTREALAPVERMYVGAIRRAETDPEQAIADLQALTDLYDDDSELAPEERQCLALAVRQIERLEREVERYAPQVTDELRERLERADQLATDQPEKARRIWQALVQLYENKPWAAEIVAEARAKLDAGAAGERLSGK